MYAGKSEYKCFRACLSDKVKANPDTECTADDADTCATECATSICFTDPNTLPLIGNATIDLATCMQDHCAKQCFGADTCGN